MIHGSPIEQAVLRDDGGDGWVLALLVRLRPEMMEWPDMTNDPFWALCNMMATLGGTLLNSRSSCRNRERETEGDIDTQYYYIYIDIGSNVVAIFVHSCFSGRVPLES